MVRGAGGSGKLLRSGADLIVTTRFPRDAATRYAQEEDFEEWGHRLRIYGLDLRHTPSVAMIRWELGITVMASGVPSTPRPARQVLAP